MYGSLLLNSLGLLNIKGWFFSGEVVTPTKRETLLNLKQSLPSIRQKCTADHGRTFYMWSTRLVLYLVHSGDDTVLQYSNADHVDPLMAS